MTGKDPDHQFQIIIPNSEFSLHFYAVHSDTLNTDEFQKGFEGEGVVGNGSKQELHSIAQGWEIPFGL